MRVMCAKHPNVALNMGVCIECSNEAYKYHAHMKAYPATGITMSGSMHNGVPQIRPKKVIIDGTEQDSYHNTDYIEYEVPAALVTEIEAFIELKIKEYKTKCMCLACTEMRYYE